MHNIIALMSGTQFFWSLGFIALVAMIFFMALKMREASENMSLHPKNLQKIKEETIPLLVALRHPAPTQAFLLIETLVLQKGLSEQNLGISLRELVSYASRCQGCIIESLHSDLLRLRTAMIEHTEQNESPGKWALEGEEKIFVPIMGAIERLKKARDDNTAIIERLEHYYPSPQPFRLSEVPATDYT